MKVTLHGFRSDSGYSEDLVNHLYVFFKDVLGIAGSFERALDAVVKAIISLKKHEIGEAIEHELSE